MLAAVRREAIDETGLFSDGAANLPADGALFTVFVDAALFNEDRELNRLLRELLFCTACRVNLDWLDTDDWESFLRNELLRTGKLGRLCTVLRGPLPPPLVVLVRND